MGFADSFSQYVCFMFFTVWVGLLLAMKLFRTVDDDGAIKKKAQSGLIGFFTRMLK